jgi:hypothetical protein
MRSKWLLSCSQALAKPRYFPPRFSLLIYYRPNLTFSLTPIRSYSNTLLNFKSPYQNFIRTCSFSMHFAYLNRPSLSDPITIIKLSEDHMNIFVNAFLSIYTISQQMHCYDTRNLLISYSSYMFQRMYVIITEPSFMCPAELN